MDMRIKSTCLTKRFILSDIKDRINMADWCRQVEDQVHNGMMSIPYYRLPLEVRTKYERFMWELGFPPKRASGR